MIRSLWGISGEEEYLALKQLKKEAKEERQLEIAWSLHALDVVIGKLGARRFLNHVAYWLDERGYDFELVRKLKEAAKAK